MFSVSPASPVSPLLPVSPISLSPQYPPAHPIVFGACFPPPGENNGCAWHCGLSGQGGGSCTNDGSTGGDSGESLPPDMSKPSPSTGNSDPTAEEETCSCQPSMTPVVTADYFSQELGQVAAERISFPFMLSLISN